MRFKCCFVVAFGNTKRKTKLINIVTIRCIARNSS